MPNDASLTPSSPAMEADDAAFLCDWCPNTGKRCKICSVVVCSCDWCPNPGCSCDYYPWTGGGTTPAIRAQREATGQGRPAPIAVAIAGGRPPRPSRQFSRHMNTDPYARPPQFGASSSSAKIPIPPSHPPPTQREQAESAPYSRCVMHKSLMPRPSSSMIDNCAGCTASTIRARDATKRAAIAAGNQVYRPSLRYVP